LVEAVKQKDIATMPEASPLARQTIERIWISAAGRLGLRVVRNPAAFASYDGAGTLTIANDEALDADDSVAQLVFHELCHGLVQGPESGAQPDWGLSNQDAQDVWREHACLRLHVYLAGPFGLREMMAPTTEYRAYHDALGGDPFRPLDDPAAVLARSAIERVASREWLTVLRAALQATRDEVDRGKIESERGVLPDAGASGDTSASVNLHVSGFPVMEDPEKTCASCAWMYRGGRGRPVTRCRASAGADGVGLRVDEAMRACERWEAALDCQTCGACCREAYHSVTVAVRDPVVWKHPDLIERHGHRFEIRRTGERCAALVDRRNETAKSLPVFSCSIYDDRPTPCRQFEAGGSHCLVARRRVGLSR